MKPLTAAIIAANGSLGVSGAAHAVHINPDGLGQVLLYPYYTSAINRFPVYPSVNKTLTEVKPVSTGSTYKAVKVRFFEGKNSKEVNDFNLFLSAQDVWKNSLISSAFFPQNHTPLPIIILSTPREESKIPTEDELTKIINRGTTMEGYFPT